MKIYNFYNKTKYPNFPFIKERRLYELNWLLPRLKGKTLIDVGCGDGALLDCLYRLTDLELSGCDFSEKLMQNTNKNIKTFYYDCKKPKKLKSDIIILAAVLPYLEDEEIKELLKNIEYNYLFVRAPCSTEREKIDKFSEDLNDYYQALYRTLDEMIDILPNVIEYSRIYPDEIESKYGTNQYYFICKKI
jgi:trans-aconitate methyltransferase